MSENDSNLLKELKDLVLGLGSSLHQELQEGLNHSILLKQIFDMVTSMNSRLEQLESGLQQTQMLHPMTSGRVTDALTDILNGPQHAQMLSPRRTILRPAATASYQRMGLSSFSGDPTQEVLAQGKADSKCCQEPGCNRPARSRGLCSAHYQRLRYRERKNEELTAEPAAPSAYMPPAVAAASLSPAFVSSLPSPRVSTILQNRSEGGSKGVFAILYDEKGRRSISGLINQIKHDRRDLLERLNLQYQGMPGVPLEEEDLLRVIHFHKLGDALHKRESDIICRCLTKQRGSLVKSAQAMKMEPEQLKTRIEELGISDQISRIRNGFREAILEQGTLQQRLELALHREKYLVDLGIVGEVDTAIRTEIDARFPQLAQKPTEEVERSVRHDLVLDDEQYRRLMKRLGIAVTDTQATQGPGVVVESR
jgi:hypothetical protein